MSAPYRSELCHAIDPSYANGVPIRSANEYQTQNDIIEEDDDSGDEVYGSDVTEIFADAQLTEAQIDRSCQWIDKSTLETCGAGISYKSVPAHLRVTHGIKGKEESTKTCCCWKGCGRNITFKNFTRHIRERHLGHSRLKKDS